MKRIYDLSQLRWHLSGWTPYEWLFDRTTDLFHSCAEVSGINAKVPGSVQGALRKAGILPDWNKGLNGRDCEWAENRHWIYETQIPNRWLRTGNSWRLNCLGLDYNGWIFVNGREVAQFKGSFTPHVFELTPYMREKNNSLNIIFDYPPRWLGQFGFTSRIKDWKPRFNYTWDWTARLVQTGIWDSVFLESSNNGEIRDFRCTTDVNFSNKTCSLRVCGSVSPGSGRYLVRLSLEKDGVALHTEKLEASKFNKDGFSWKNLPVDLWWPNLHGKQPLYLLSCRLLDEKKKEADLITRQIGFKSLTWLPCRGAPEKAEPWLCVVNGRPVFLQGVNWTPVRPNFADVTFNDYRRRLKLYQNLGCNILRVWGGGYLEKEFFYDLCDELGFLVWQEFPLSSSGMDNWPPEDKASIAEMAQIAESYISRRQHHVSLSLWCGGNELQGNLKGGKAGSGRPVGYGHPLIYRLKSIVAKRDPARRFLATSAGGPRFTADESNFGKGLHWDVHGPWKAEGKLEEEWRRYWQKDDALFRSEVGASGASPAKVIREFRGDYPETPGNAENPLWRRSAWWIEWPQFIGEKGREPKNLEEYVRWSQKRQAQALAIAVEACQARFPACGGIIIWMGHDSFPCTANTSIIDFCGNPKPAAKKIRKLFRRGR